jgi:hypothetical protein
MFNGIMSVFFRITGCINDACYIRMRNADYISYAFVNEHYVVYQLGDTDSDFIDFTAYIQNGLNNFTFLTYNDGGGYRWGFEIMKNDEIIFDDTAGLPGSVSANNGDTSHEDQFVYNNTVSVNVTKCTTISTTPSTGEFFYWSLGSYALECISGYNLIKVIGRRTSGYCVTRVTYLRVLLKAVRANNSTYKVELPNFF